MIRILVFLAAILVLSLPLRGETAKRPNIVWILADDMSPHFGCYGETLIKTPNVDRLAAEGVKFSNAFTTAPVCSASRSALITGHYQTSIGAHHHRSGRGTGKIFLPAGTEPLPVLFRKAGYHTSNGSLPNNQPKLGKTDYNFEWDEAMYDGKDWSGRTAGQPFFAQIQLNGGKHRHHAKWDETALRELGSLTNPADVVLPPYYPRDPVLLKDWAQYLDSVRYLDKLIGRIIDRLTKEGELDNTIVFFLTDHGISHARGKQFLYDEGTRVPVVVRGPGLPRGEVRTDLISHVDLAATSLALAGIPIPATDSRDLFTKDRQPREAVFSARDRCDETVDHLRSVRTTGFKYIRNFLPRRPLLQPNRYKDNKPIVKRLRQLHEEKALDQIQETLLFAETRPAEELYDLRNDPFELKNLAADPASKAVLEDLRGRLDQWISNTGDQGQTAESEARYDSDMAVYLGGGPESPAQSGIRANIALMKQWAAEGK